MTDERPDDGKIVAFRNRSEHVGETAPEPQPEEFDRTRANVAALVFAAILVLVGWWLVEKLSTSSRIEDCLMAGRNNCAPIETPARSD